jgi:hypothetical protein
MVSSVSMKKGLGRKKRHEGMRENISPKNNRIGLKGLRK